MGSSPSPESTTLSYEPEPRRADPVGAEAGDRAGLCVLALVEGHVRDPLEQLRVMLQAADMAPGDLVGATPKCSSLSAWSRVSIASISAFLCTKAASASSFDLIFVLLVPAVISGSTGCRSR
jgi:hypothetical protein